MLNLAAEPSSFAITFHRRRSRARHPYRAARSNPSLSGKNRRAALPFVVLTHLAARPDSQGKMLLTDLCNRPLLHAPEYRSIPGELTPGGAMVDDILQLQSSYTRVSPRLKSHSTPH